MQRFKSLETVPIWVEHVDGEGQLKVHRMHDASPMPGPCAYR